MTWQLKLILLISYRVITMDIKLGFLFAHDNVLRSDLRLKFGFSTSAGAVPIAIERIETEQILPGANISVSWRYSECDESLASGLSIQMLMEEQVDVIIGPPCAMSFAMVAVFTHYFNIPQIGWATTTFGLNNKNFSQVIGSSNKLGGAITELLVYFGWTKVALLYSDDMDTRKCISVAQGIDYHFPMAGIQVVYFQEILREKPTDAEIDKFFSNFAPLTRIAIVCIEVDIDISRFMLHAAERGCVGKEYVYLIPDYVQPQSRTEHGEHLKAKKSIKNANILFMEMIMPSNEKLSAFKKSVVQSVQTWPFFHEFETNISDTHGSLYSPFLHDSIYLYALALNKTLERSGNNTNGLLLENIKNIQFQGMTGHVVMDDVGDREPIFIVKHINDGKQRDLLKVEMYKNAGERISLLTPEAAILEFRTKYQLKRHPQCGWLTVNDECTVKIDSSFIPYIVVVSICCIILIGGIVFAVFHNINKVLIDDMAFLLWKIDSREIEKLVDMQTGKISSRVSDDIAEVVLKGNQRVYYFRKQLVWTKCHQSGILLNNKQNHARMKMLRNITHDNLNVFHGICIEGSQLLSVWKYCSKGSLQNVLSNCQLKIDSYFKHSFIRDLVNGMDYIHESDIKSHGSLKSSNCLINSQWVLVITDYGLNQMNNRPIQDLLWTSPEILKNPFPPLSGTQSGDVFSFSIIVSEIITRELPYSSYGKLPQEIVNLVGSGLEPPFRPDINDQKEFDNDMITLMNNCWNENPKFRPNFKQIKSVVKLMTHAKHGSLMEYVVKMMERYTTKMEQSIADQTKMVAGQTTKTDDLLYKFFPRHVAQKLKNALPMEHEFYDNVTLCFTCISEFSKIVEKSNPMQIVNLLNDITVHMDDIIDQYERAFKVQACNDKYMIVVGLDPDAAFSYHGEIRSLIKSRATSDRTTFVWTEDGIQHHTCTAANLALHLLLNFGNYYMAHLPDMKCQLQIGLHTGPVMTTVLGTVTPKYVMYGDTVTIGQMVMNEGKSGCVHISEKCNEYLTELLGGFVTKPRGEIRVSSFSTIFTYWLMGKKSIEIDDQTQPINDSRMENRN